MGNLTFSILRIFEYSFPKTASEDSVSLLLSQKLESVEERCDRLDIFQDLKPGLRSFLLFRTTDNYRVRVDYADGSVEPDISFNFRDKFNSQSFRYASVDNGLTLGQALEIVRSHCVKQSFHRSSHHCQHVCLDSFKEITGIETFLLRNDYLRWLRRRFHYSDKRNAHERDPYELKVKKSKKTIGTSFNLDQLQVIYGGLDDLQDVLSLATFAVQLASIKYLEKFLDPGFKETRKKMWKRAQGNA